MSLCTALRELEQDSVRNTYKQIARELLERENHEVVQSTPNDSQISDKNCHPWMFRNKTSGECECSDIPYRAVLCDPTIPKTSILDCYCMTYNHERNETELGQCLFGCGHKIDTVYNTLPHNKSALNEYTCGKANRDSTLCGACKPGYSPLVYSYELKCMNCTGMSYNWIKYIAVAYVPLTFFFFIVVLFRFSGTHPLVRGFITVCQGLASSISLRAYLTVAESTAYTNILLRTTGTLYGIWNLDFFRLVIPPICLNLSSLQALALDYAIAFYPLLLVVLTYILIILHSRGVRIVVCLWKPFQKLCASRKNWDLQGSVVKAFATFFLLSYLKILNTTFDLLVFTNMYSLPFGEKYYYKHSSLYYDASVEYFKGSHLYYGIAAIFVGIFFVFLPLVFLVIYPMRWFQKCLNVCHIQRQSIDIFINCYQGYYKDGTNGTRDYRCFSVTFFLVQLVAMAFYSLSKTVFFFTLEALTTILFMFIILTVQPYKEQFKAYSVIDAFMLLLLGVMNILSVATDEAGIKAFFFLTGTNIALGLIGMIPLVYFVVFSIWWIFVNRELKHKLPCFRRVGYNTLQSRSQEFNDFPDRIENPSTYEAQTAPLLCNQKCGGHQKAKHRATLSSTRD